MVPHGSGKSTFINAILYVLYNKTLNNVGKERLINRTNASKTTLMEVSITFKKDNDTYFIKRCRGAGYDVQIMKNGVDQTPDSVSNIDAKIQEIIGISYAIFSRIVVFNGNTQKFLDMGLNDQRNFIEELFRITELSQKAIILKEEIKQTENSIEIEKAIIKEKEIQHNLRLKRISEAETRIIRWEEDKESKLANITRQLARIENVDFDAESDKIKTLNELKSRITEHTKIVNETNRSITQFEKEIAKLQNELKHLEDAKCPYCLQKFEDANAKIQSIKDDIAEKIVTVTDLVAARDVIDAEIASIEADYKTINATVIHNDLAELLKIKSQADALNIQKSELQVAANPHLEVYDSLVSENEEAIDTKKLDTLHVTLEHQKFLLKLLTDKNSFIRKAIISKSIPFLNSRIEYYTKELLLPHSVTFEPDMSCTITEYGRELDHGNLSAGEQKRLNLALSLAFRDVLSHLHTKVNLLLCDEIDGGSLCIPTMNSLIHLLKAKSRDDDVGIWCISHSSEFDGRLDNVMTIRKENGFSYVADD